jgi:hypothetical protein
MRFQSYQVSVRYMQLHVGLRWVSYVLVCVCGVSVVCGSLSLGLLGPHWAANETAAVPSGIALRTTTRLIRLFR